MNWCFFTILFVGLLTTYTSGCRSSVDTEREPIISHHGTEPPEPVHNKPADGEAKPPDETGGKHEDGEIEVRPNVWEFPVAQTKKGMLWGTVEESRGRKRILAFRGIKYAQPPVGGMRWKKPIAAPAWEGIRYVSIKLLESILYIIVLHFQTKFLSQRKIVVTIQLP